MHLNGILGDAAEPRASFQNEVFFFPEFAESGAASFDFGLRRLLVIGLV